MCLGTTVTPSDKRVTTIQRFEFIFLLLIMGGIFGRRSGGAPPPPPAPTFSPTVLAELEASKNARAKAEKALAAKIKEGQATEEKLNALQNTISNIKAREQALIREQNERVNEEKRRLSNLGMDHINKYNFAICGRTGEGKSSLINVLRGKYFGDDDYAPVADGVQCTMETTMYPFSAEIPYFVLWDIPGGATYEHPGASYYQDKCLDLFDTTLIMYSGRIDQLVEHILTEAKAHNKLHAIAVVYSKTGQDVHQLMRRERLGRVEATRKFRASVEKEFRSSLSRVLGGDAELVRLFFACAHTWEDEKVATYDEQALVEFLIAAAAQRFEASAYAHTLRARLTSMPNNF